MSKHVFNKIGNGIESQVLLNKANTMQHDVLFWVQRLVNNLNWWKFYVMTNATVK